MNPPGGSDGGPDQPGLDEAHRSSAFAGDAGPAQWAFYALAQFLSSRPDRPWSLSMEIDGRSLTIWQGPNDGSPRVREFEGTHIDEDLDPMASGIRQHWAEYDISEAATDDD